MISLLLFINSKGEILIYRSYRDDVSRAEATVFCQRVIAKKEAKEKPILSLGSCHFIHITVGDITLVACTKSNVNVSCVFSFLFKLVDLFKAYFNGTLDENAVRKHFVLIYELLDEIADFGFPQFLEADILKLYITQGGVQSRSESDARSLQQYTVQATGAISWRKEDIRYRKNEVYIDVIENVNVLLSNKGTILRSDVQGQIMVKALLSGMPECKFGMNDKLVMSKDASKKGTADKGIAIDDVRFHQCVKLGKFDRDRTVTFVPPDGTFELMTYRITENINLPFKVLPVIQELGRSRIEASVKVKAIFDVNIFASNVVIKVPCPKNTAVANIFVGAGKAKYEPEHSAIVWRIRRFPGDTEYVLRAEVDLAATTSEKQWSKPPISMDFQVPMFTASGLRVRYLRIYEKSNYKTTKWIRYITRAGSYQHRI
eukprot:GILI01008446.1.p1 GENE.GILI01008446.1~~GILI01008446.1.p1  ORF type:complete len:430 (+),score=112.44 GILI01008446.1:49-1338(+)